MSNNYIGYRYLYYILFIWHSHTSDFITVYKIKTAVGLMKIKNNDL